MSKATPLEEKLSRETLITFGSKRIVSFLYFGTRAFGLNVNDDSDYDFMLVLDKYSATDVMKLRKIMRRKPFSGSDINLNLMYLSDIKTRGKANFQIRSLSLTFYQYLVESKLLLGRNIFKKDPIKLTQRLITKIQDFKIQEYYGRCDKLYFQKITDKKLYLQLKKYTKDIVWLLLIREGKLKFNDLAKVPFEKMLELAESNNFISGSVGRDLLNVLKKDFSKVNLQKAEKIRRLLYQKYLQLQVKNP